MSFDSKDESIERVARRLQGDNALGFRRMSAAFPCDRYRYAHKRFIESGNRLTSGGISSGLDQALKPITLLFDEETAAAVHVSTQYFPEPPVAGRIPAAPRCMVKWRRGAALEGIRSFSKPTIERRITSTG